MAGPWVSSSAVQKVALKAGSKVGLWAMLKAELTAAPTAH